MFVCVCVCLCVCICVCVHYMCMCMCVCMCTCVCVQSQNNYSGALIIHARPHETSLCKERPQSSLVPSEKKAETAGHEASHSPRVLCNSSRQSSPSGVSSAKSPHTSERPAPAAGTQYPRTPAGKRVY